MRSIFAPFAAIIVLGIANGPVQAKSIWKCEYAKDRLLLTASMQVDSAPPGFASPDTGLTLKGNVELVLSQAFSAPGKASTAIKGGYRLDAFVKDNDATIILGPDRKIDSAEWLIDRRMPDGSFAGMFRNQPIADGIGRRLRANFGELTMTTPPEYLHFHWSLPIDFRNTSKHYTRIPTAEFKALHAKGLAKAQSATAAELKKC
jgi:hypothetical protein